MSIKAFIFDFGNVICKFDKTIFLKKLSFCCDKSVGELEKLIYHDTDACIRFETGLISGDEFYREIVELCRLSISESDFIDGHINIFTPISETFDLIKKLKPAYKLGLLSNTAVWDFERGIKQIEIFSLFDAVTASFEVGAMKPDKAIFDDMTKKIKLAPQNCIYIDDIKQFADAGRLLGFNAIHYQGHDNLLEQLREMGIRY